MPQEQLLQRGRLAGQAPDPGRGEMPQHLIQPGGVHLAPHPGAAGPEVLHVEVMHARHLVQPGGRPGQFGGDRRPGQMPQPGERAGFHGAARPDDRHPVTQRFHLGQDVAGEQHRAPLAAFFLHAGAERGLHQRVESGRGLIQDQQLGIGGQRRDQGDLLPVALGVRPCLLRRVQVEALQQAGPAVRVQPAAQPPEQVDDLAAGQVRPERHVTGHVRQPAVQRGSVAPRIAAEQPGRPAAGPQQAEQDPDGGGLTRPVRPEEAVHLPGRHGQVKRLQRAGPAE